MCGFADFTLFVHAVFQDCPSNIVRIITVSMVNVYSQACLWLLHQPPARMQVLDKYLTTHGSKGGPFLLGSRYSIAEVNAAPWVRSAKLILEAHRGINYVAAAKQANLHRFSDWAQVRLGP